MNKIIYIIIWSIIIPFAYLYGLRYGISGGKKMLSATFKDIKKIIS